MQSAYKQEHEEYRRALRRFLDAELEPNIERFVADGGHDTSFWLKADEAGMLGVTIPEEYGTDEMQKIAIARSLWGGRAPRGPAHIDGKSSKRGAESPVPRQLHVLVRRGATIRGHAVNSSCLVHTRTV